MSARLVGLKRGIVAAERADRLRGASSIRAAGEAFLATNAERPGVVVLPSGVQYRVIRPGTGRSPTATDRVSVRYRSERLDGTAFHDSLREGGAPEILRMEALIPGLRQALQHMSEGARWKIFLPPELAFGHRGPLEDHTVVYDLQLLAVLPADDDTAETAR